VSCTVMPLKLQQLLSWQNELVGCFYCWIIRLASC
jgi:hypothetical protein